MAERRALIEGLTEAENIDPNLAEEFINDEKPTKPPETFAACSAGGTPGH